MEDNLYGADKEVNAVDGWVDIEDLMNAINWVKISIYDRINQMPDEIKIRHWDTTGKLRVRAKSILRWKD